MFWIKQYNKIDKKGISKFEDGGFDLDSQKNVSNGAILLRSYKLTPDDIIDGTLAVGRAGIGVNNVPVSYCTENGIVVFNTPGANANSVKELVLMGLLIVSRNIKDAVDYAKSLKNEDADEIKKLVEANKAKFKGFEIKGKKLGVIGLGAIGRSVANDAVSLGMDVIGFDPFMSVENAWELSRRVKAAKSLESMLSIVDFLTIHVPLTDGTRNLLDSEKLACMKKSSVILNFSRAEIINEDVIVKALNSGSIAKYVTDFPSKVLLNTAHVVNIPHLGASTAEAELNCAIMVSDQVKDFLENGNIKNSVNFPECYLERRGDSRLIVANYNIPNMVGQIATILANEGLNIVNMINKSRGDIAYNIVDITGKVSENVIKNIRKIDGVIMDRVL